MSEPPAGAVVRTRDGRRLVDLTVTITDGLEAGGIVPPAALRLHVTHEDSRQYRLGTPDDPLLAAVGVVAVAEHVGTHVDAPLHVKPDGASIDQLPLDLFTGPAVCLDLRHIPPRGDIDVADLEAAEQAAGVRVDGHIVLLCTGHHLRTWPRPEAFTENPALTAAATHWLADRGSRLHGIDAASTDRIGDALFTSHRVCRDRGIVHVEWLANLELLIGAGEFTFWALPIPYQGMTGSQVRAVAELQG